MMSQIGVRVSAAARAAAVGALALMAASAQAGEVGGMVKLEGDPPKPAAIDVSGARADKDNKKCLEHHPEGVIFEQDVLRGDNGGLKNVFVYVKTGLEKKDYPTPAEHATLDQKGCIYEPRVQGVMVNQTLDIRNSDPFIHNVRSYARRNQPFNLGQNEPGVREKIFRRPEPHVKIKCDIHRWMTSYVWVMEHPFFAVSDDKGSFTIKDLPAGDYTIGAWHEKYGEQEGPAKVSADGKVEVNFTFKVEKPS